MMIPILKFVFIYRTVTVCTFEIHVFLAALTIGKVMLTPRFDIYVSLELGHRFHLLRHGRRMVLFPSQFRLLPKLIMLV